MATEHLVFRADKEIADQARRMAAERGMELPDVLRMMLAKAVRLDDFMLDSPPGTSLPPVQPKPDAAWEPRQWSPLLEALDAEAALALLHREIAQRTARLEDRLARKLPDLAHLQAIRDERDRACVRLLELDVADHKAVTEVLRQYAMPSSEVSAKRRGAEAAP